MSHPKLETLYEVVWRLTLNFLDSDKNVQLVAKVVVVARISL